MPAFNPLARADRSSICPPDNNRILRIAAAKETEPMKPLNRYFAARYSESKLWAAAIGCAWALLFAPIALAADWPQWCGSDGKNMVSEEKNLPDSFVPGVKNTRTREIQLGTAKNVRWGRKLCESIYSTPGDRGRKDLYRRPPGESRPDDVPGRANGKTPLAVARPRPRKFPTRIDGWSIGISDNPPALGVCSSPLVDGDRVYFVTQRFQGRLSGRQRAASEGREPARRRVVWRYDMWDTLERLSLRRRQRLRGGRRRSALREHVERDRSQWTPGEGEVSHDPVARCAELDRPGEEHRTPGGDR